MKCIWGLYITRGCGKTDILRKIPGPPCTCSEQSYWPQGRVQCCMHVWRRVVGYLPSPVYGFSSAFTSAASTSSILKISCSNEVLEQAEVNSVQRPCCWRRCYAGKGISAGWRITTCARSHCMESCPLATMVFGLQRTATKTSWRSPCHVDHRQWSTLFADRKAWRRTVPYPSGCILLRKQPQGQSWKQKEKEEEP